MRALHADTGYLLYRLGLRSGLGVWRGALAGRAPVRGEHRGAGAAR